MKTTIARKSALYWHKVKYASVRSCSKLRDLTNLLLLSSARFLPTIVLILIL
jgi:hypothetical protein